MLTCETYPYRSTNYKRRVKLHYIYILIKLLYYVLSFSCIKDKNYLKVVCLILKDIFESFLLNLFNLHHLGYHEICVDIFFKGEKAPIQIGVLASWMSRFGTKDFCLSLKFDILGLGAYFQMGAKALIMFYMPRS